MSRSETGLESRWFRFWWRWLLVACVGQILLGFTITFAIDTPLWSWHQTPMAETLWDTSEVPANLEAYRRFTMGMLGPTVSAWAVALFFVTLVPFRRGEGWSWWCIAAATMIWFPFDTVISVQEEIWVNVVFNCSGLALIALPLAATYRCFRR